MGGALPLLLLHAFTTWTGSTLLFFLSITRFSFGIAAGVTKVFQAYFMRSIALFHFQFNRSASKRSPIVRENKGA
jgi:hypothetical protein